MRRPGSFSRASSRRDARKIGQRTKGEAAVERAEKIVLMTRQNEPRPQPTDRLGKSRPRIRQCHAENREIDRLDVVRREQRGRSAGVDVDALPRCLDEKSERLTANPITRPAWTTGPAPRTGKRNPIGKARSCAAGRTRILHGPICRTSPGPTTAQRAGVASAAIASSTAVREASRRAPVISMIVGTSSK